MYLIDNQAVDKTIESVTFYVKSRKDFKSIAYHNITVEIEYSVRHETKTLIATRLNIYSVDKKRKRKLLSSRELVDITVEQYDNRGRTTRMYLEEIYNGVRLSSQRKWTDYTIDGKPLDFGLTKHYKVSIRTIQPIGYYSYR